jgi:hypothetical protein
MAMLMTPMMPMTPMRTSSRDLVVICCAIAGWPGDVEFEAGSLSDFGSHC